MDLTLANEINFLRQKNRHLLKQLESNSALIANELKMLQGNRPCRSLSCTRGREGSQTNIRFCSVCTKTKDETPPVTCQLHKDEMRLSPGLLKRRYNCWKERNSPGQVSRVANSNETEHNNTPESSDTVAREALNKLSPQRKRTVDLGEEITGPQSARVNLVDARCGSAVRHVKKARCARRYGRSRIKRVTQATQDPCSVSIAGRKYKSKRTVSPDHGLVTKFDSFDSVAGEYVKNTTNEAKKLIDYVPQSQFLRKYHLRSQGLGDMQDQGINRIAHSADCSHSKLTPVNCRKDDLMSKGDNKTSGETGSFKRKNSTHHLPDCPCSQPEAFECGDTPRPSPSYHVIAGLLDNERERKMIPCHGKFEELRKFRESHWFDCHAHSGTPRRASQGSLHDRFGGRSSPPKISSLESQHKCVHHFKLNSRLFPEPVHPDRWNNSRCRTCNGVRRSGSGSECGRNLQKPEDVLVTVPYTTLYGSEKENAACRDCKNHIYTRSSAFPLERKLPTKIRSPASWDTLRPGGVGSQCSLQPSTKVKLKKTSWPLPSDSLALRFQTAENRKKVWQSTF